MVAGIRSRLRGYPACWALALLAAASAFSFAPPAARAGSGPLIWDQDADRIDDRIQRVDSLGYAESFEQGDTLLRQRFTVARVANGLVFGVYVRYERTPTPSDITQLTLLGMPVLARIEAVPALRSVATFAQVTAAAGLPGVTMIEVTPFVYLGVRDGAAATGVRDASGSVFPNWAAALGGSGHGQVIAFLDTGVNDAPDGPWPGHDGLAGRCLGGAIIDSPDSTANTPPNGSVNPGDHGLITEAHATHIAGIALGSGAPNGYATGIAPGARFVDVKVLDDTGTGSALPEALDWCIRNRTRNWGDPYAQGIDVINLSLSSLDASDGQDLASALASKAAQLGIVVVASMGNDGLTGHVPSPAAGDGVIAVGAWDTRRTGDTSDDAPASFSNAGPRAAGGGAGDEIDPHLLEKPDLVAPGVAILSADGRLTGDGSRYWRLSGTSMAAAFVSGVAALLREQDPTLTPAALAALLRRSAWRDLPGLPAVTGGVDPAWRPDVGFGLLDANEARLELLAAGHTQLRRMRITDSPDSIAIDAWSGRERGTPHIVIERASDQAGQAGPFVAYDSLAAAGDSSLAGPGFHRYAFRHPLPPGERGVPFWWRMACFDAGSRVVSAARRVAGPTGPAAAEFDVTIVHDAYDHDVSAWVETPGAAGPFAVPASVQSDSSDVVAGTSETGTIAWSFCVGIPAGSADAQLPPSAAHPWTLHVQDGGYLNRSGRVTAYSIVWHAPGGDQTFTATSLPRPLVEGGEITVQVPDAVTAVTPDPPPIGRLRVQPNPAWAAEGVTISLGTPAARVEVFDLSGRRVAVLGARDATQDGRLHWSARGADGRVLPAGVYVVRAGRASARIVLLGR